MQGNQRLSEISTVRLETTLGVVDSLVSHVGDLELRSIFPVTAYLESLHRISIIVDSRSVSLAVVECSEWFVQFSIWKSEIRMKQMY